MNDYAMKHCYAVVFLFLSFSTFLWADGNPSGIGCTMDLTVNNAAQSTCYNDGAEIKLGNVTALRWNNFSFRMTKYDNGNVGNLCADAWCHYTWNLVHDSENWQDISQTNIIWNYNNNKNDVEYQGALNMDLVAGKPSGNYILKYCFFAHGNYYYNGDCSSSFWYPKDSYFTLTYTILPPNVQSGQMSVDATGAFSGEGTSNKPWLVYVGDTLVLTSNAPREWEDTNSKVYMKAQNDESFSDTLFFTSTEETEDVSVPISGKSYNAVDDLLSKDSRSKTIHYQFVLPSVTFDAGTGFCATASLKETAYQLGIILPTATPSSDCVADDWTFAGWSETAVAEATSTAPTLYQTGTTYYPKANTTLYAVYQKTEGGDYSLVTSNLDNWEGQYLLSDNANHFLNGSLPGGSGDGAANAANTSVDLSMYISDHAIPAAIGDLYYVTIETITDGYAIRTQSENTPYFYATKSQNIASTKNKETARISIYWDSYMQIVSTDVQTTYVKQLCYNNGYFRFYETLTPIVVYKKDAQYSTYHSSPVSVPKYTLTYDLNGGSGIVPATNRYPQDSVITLPSVTNLIKDGFRCVGWNTSADASTPLTSFSMPAQDITLYAVWAPLHVILWKGENDFITSDIYIAGETVSLPTITPSSVNNRDFVGWTTEQYYRGNTPPAFIGEHICTGAETFYAVYANQFTYTTQPLVPTYLLTYRYEGVSVECDQVREYLGNNKITLPAAKVLRGNTFTGWSDGSTLYLAGSTYTMPQQNVTLTATYTPWTINLSYDGTSISTLVPDGGLVIPSVLPAEYPAADNNQLIGFTHTADYSGTNLPSDFVALGTTYLPQTDAETLYALYRQGDATYQLIKSSSDLRLGAHVILASFDEDYAMGNTLNEEQSTLPAVAVVKDADTETLTQYANDVQEFTLTTNGLRDKRQVWSFQKYDSKKTYLASRSGDVDRLAFSSTAVADSCSFFVDIDSQGRAHVVSADSLHTHATLSMGTDGVFAAVSSVDNVDLALYQHIGTGYSTTSTAVYRVRSITQTCGRVSPNDYFVEGANISLSVSPNDGSLSSSANRYAAFRESDGDTVSTRGAFVMPAFNVLDSVRLKKEQDTLYVDKNTSISGEQKMPYIIVDEGATLTVTADAHIQNLQIYGGGSVAVSSGTLSVDKLSFAGGLDDKGNFAVPHFFIDPVASLATANDTIYYFLNVTPDHFYPFSLPFPSAMADIRYASHPNSDVSKFIGDKIKVERYDGEARGKGEATTTNYWQPLTASDTIFPSVGYIVSAVRLKGEPFASLRFTMVVDNAWTTLGEQNSVTQDDKTFVKNTVSVGAWGVGGQRPAAWYNQGWNYIANPYMASISGYDNTTQLQLQNGTSVRYATIPSAIVDDYDQLPIASATLQPFYGFFVQVGETGTIAFDNSLRRQAPAYLSSEPVAMAEQEAYIRISGNGMNDQFGLLIHSRYSAAYDLNADLTKELGSASTLRAYMLHASTKMAYLALDSLSALQTIPVEVRIPQKGTYRFALTGQTTTSSLSALWLYDKEQNRTTNLLQSDYEFEAVEGLSANRFSLNPSFAPSTPTALPFTESGGGDIPRKFIYQGNIYILVNGILFNAEGKEVRL